MTILVVFVDPYEESLSCQSVKLDCRCVKDLFLCDSSIAVSLLPQYVPFHYNH